MFELILTIFAIPIEISIFAAFINSATGIFCIIFAVLAAVPHQTTSLAGGF